ncbi:MAG: 50S ribosomal protein L19, partial [Acidobacteriia bacterium]|nr:50S ribosomal protein L19 [Terriglobia bacterium]
MSNALLEKVSGKYKRAEVPAIEPGDTVRVQVR